MNILAPFYRLYEWKLHHQIKSNEPPRHIGVILDGNRRYGRLRKLEAWESHQFGADRIEDFLHWCWESNIKFVTLYALSTDNLHRSSKELEEIFAIAETLFKKVITDKYTHEREVRVKAIGSIKELPANLQEVIEKAEKSTSDYNNFFLNVAIGYGGRTEIIDAVRKVAQEVKDGDISPTDIKVENLEKYLYTAGLPDPDLIIRTSGEERISGFLLWQSAYSEFYFSEVFWPMIRRIDLWRAIRTFQRRKRRYGK